MTYGLETMPMNKAMPIHHTATVDTPWDGPAAVAAMPNKASVLMYCHAWMADDAVDSDSNDDDNDADDKKSSYKFPHHATKGGPANLNACRNGLARLSNANIPDKDRAGVKAHLQAHLDDANKGRKGNSSDVKPLAQRMATARPMAKLVQGDRDWYRIENKSSDVSDVYIYNEIGYLGVNASDFVSDLNKIRANRIKLHINSPGGEVFDGVTIYNALKNSGKRIEVSIDGLAASAASFIAMAGDHIVMQKTATMMIHDGMGMGIGNSSDMRSLADLLDKTSNTIASIYADRTGQPIEDWRNAMLAETWYNAEEALGAGLVDEIQGEGNASRYASNSWDMSIFNYSGREYAPGPNSKKGNKHKIKSKNSNRDIELDIDYIVAALQEAF